MLDVLLVAMSRCGQLMKTIMKSELPLLLLIIIVLAAAAAASYLRPIHHAGCKSKQ
jgi:hypothetical protein